MKAFVDLEGGVTRSAIADASPKARSRKPEQPEKRVEKLQRKLENKNREIFELKKRISGNGSVVLGKNATRDASTAEAGTLPNFIIIGGKKCGTTFLYHLLCKHPYVAPAAKKEVHYFDVRFRKGLGWYRSQFPPPETKEGLKIITGEASPYYLYHPHAARRAAETVPQAKLITMLRDPVDRAFSDYHDKVRQGNEPLSFEEAIDAEENRLRGEREKMLADEHYKARNYRAYSYLARGIYVDQLQRWLEFFDREQMLVIKSEDMFGNVPDTLRRVLAFLDLPDWEPEISPVWEARNEGQYAPMNPATRQRLREYFAPHNHRLYEYLGTDFSW